jgi:hypothetical protein
MKVYFNNSCKICKAEIDLYKKEKIQEIDWVDITNNDLAEIETLKNSKELLRRLHVKEGREDYSRCRGISFVVEKNTKIQIFIQFF